MRASSLADNLASIVDVSTQGAVLSKRLDVLGPRAKVGVMPESPFPRHTTGLHHTALRATDFERTLKFYCEGLGFTKKVAWSMGKDGATKAVMLDAGDGNYLEVFSNGNPEDPAEARYAHIALRTDNIESAHAAALAAGAKERVAPTDFNIEDTLSGTPHTGKLSFVLGPDDEVIEFMQTQML